jgi:predicted ArsR family transcriptional regulator
MHPTWTFLTNHAHVLLCLTGDPDLRIRDIADRVGVTERAVSRILSELVAEGYLTVTRTGRRNHYVVIRDRPLRHPVERGATIAALIALLPDES